MVSGQKRSQSTSGRGSRVSVKEIRPTNAELERRFSSIQEEADPHTTKTRRSFCLSLRSQTSLILARKVGSFEPIQEISSKNSSTLPDCTRSATAQNASLQSS